MKGMIRWAVLLIMVSLFAGCEKQEIEVTTTEAVETTAAAVPEETMESITVETNVPQGGIPSWMDSLVIDGTEYIDENGNYHELDYYIGRINAGYDEEKAGREHAAMICYESEVMRIAGTVEVYDGGRVEAFYETCMAGQPARLRIVKSYIYEAYPDEVYKNVVCDVLFDGENYYCFQSEKGNMLQSTHLLRIEVADYPYQGVYYMLSSNPDLTSEDCLKAAEDSILAFIPTEPDPQKEAEAAARWWNKAKGRYEVPGELLLMNGNGRASKKIDWWLPQTVIDTIDTENLVELVADNYYMTDMSYYSEVFQGMQSLALEFNSLQELLGREDVIPVMEQYHASMDESDGLIYFTIGKMLNELKHKAARHQVTYDGKQGKGLYIGGKFLVDEQGNYRGFDQPDDYSVYRVNHVTVVENSVIDERAMDMFMKLCREGKPGWQTNRQVIDLPVPF